MTTMQGWKLKLAFHADFFYLKSYFYCTLLVWSTKVACQLLQYTLCVPYSYIQLCHSGKQSLTTFIKVLESIIIL